MTKGCKGFHKLLQIELLTGDYYSSLVTASSYAHPGGYCEWRLVWYFANFKTMNSSCVCL